MSGDLLDTKFANHVIKGDRPDIHRKLVRRPSYPRHARQGILRCPQAFEDRGLDGGQTLAATDIRPRNRRF